MQACWYDRAVQSKFREAQWALPTSKKAVLSKGNFWLVFRFRSHVKTVNPDRVSAKDFKPVHTGQVLRRPVNDVDPLPVGRCQLQHPPVAAKKDTICTEAIDSMFNERHDLVFVPGDVVRLRQ